MSIQSNPWLKGLLFGILGALFFSSKAIVAKLMYRYAPVEAIDVIALRMIFAAPMFLLVEILRKHKKKESKILPFKSILRIAFVGLFGYYLATFFDFWGLEYISAGFERIILFSYPAFVIILGYYFLKRKVSNKQIFSMLITYGGIIVIYITDVQLTGWKEITIGLILLLICALSFAVYVLFGEKKVHRYGTIQFTNYVMISVTFVILAHYGIAKGGWSDLLLYPKGIYLYGLVMAFFCTFLPAYMAMKALKLLGGIDFAIIGGVGPIITIILGVTLLDEVITVWHWLGTALVLYGVFYLQIKKK